MTLALSRHQIKPKILTYNHHLAAIMDFKEIVVVCSFKSDDQQAITPLHFDETDARIIETNLYWKYLININRKVDFKP
jgi:hypothetical protein